ncbi:MAG: Rpp14/Pop5 family protein [Sulfolobales archaeon]
MEAWLALIISIISLTISTISLYIMVKLRREVYRREIIGIKINSKSTYRERVKRYVVFRVLRIDDTPNFEELENCLKEAVKEGLGLLGSSDTSVKLIRYRVESGIGILRIVSNNIYPAIFSISRVRKCGGKRILISPLKITGTIKGAYKKISIYESKYR